MEDDDLITSDAFDAADLVYGVSSDEEAELLTRALAAAAPHIVAEYERRRQL